MDIKLNLINIQNFLLEMFATLKDEYNKPYANRLKAIFEDASLSDVEKTRQALIILDEGRKLLADPAKCDPSLSAKAAEMLNVANSVIEAVNNRSQIENMRNVARGVTYNASNVPASVTSQKGKYQAEQFVNAVVDCVIPDHEMLSAVEVVNNLATAVPDIGTFIRQNFPQYNPATFLRLSADRKKPEQSINTAIASASQINSEYNKNHVDFVCILARLKRFADSNLVLDDAQKQQINDVIDKLPKEQKENIVAINNAYEKWYECATDYLMEGYKAGKSEKKQANRFNRTTGSFASPEEKLNETLRQNAIGRWINPEITVISNMRTEINGEFTNNTTSAARRVSSQQSWDNLLTKIGSLGNATIRYEGRDTPIKDILRAFVRNNILLNVMRNTNEISPDHSKNAEVIEALQFAMKGQLDILHQCGITSYYEDIGQCVELLSSNYFQSAGLTARNGQEANKEMYDNNIFDRAAIKEALERRDMAIVSDEIRRLPNYPKMIQRLSKKTGYPVSDFPPPLDPKAPSTVPTEAEVLPPKSAGFRKGIKKAKDLEGERIEMGKKAKPSKAHKTTSAKDILIKIYKIQEIIANAAVYKAGSPEYSIILNAANTKIAELMGQFETAARNEITSAAPAGTVSFVTICNAAWTEYTAGRANSEQIAYAHGATTGKIGISSRASAAARGIRAGIPATEKIAVSDTGTTCQWEQGKVSYELASATGSGRRDVVNYTFNTASSVSATDIPDSIKLLLHGGAIPAGALAGTPLLSSVNSAVTAMVTAATGAAPTSHTP